MSGLVNLRGRQTSRRGTLAGRLRGDDGGGSCGSGCLRVGRSQGRGGHEGGRRGGSRLLRGVRSETAEGAGQRRLPSRPTMDVSPGRGDKCSTACAAGRTACSERCLASNLSGQQTRALGRRRSGFGGVVSSTFGALTRNEISARKTRRGGDSQARSRLASLHGVGAERTRGNLSGRRGRTGGCVSGGNGRARNLTGGETGGGCGGLQRLAGDRACRKSRS